MKVSRLMSTQHPDNVFIPFFAKNTVMDGEDEVKEAFYAFSHLGVDEQLWDAEGKEVDNFVVKKLLSRYPRYFREKVLGKDKIITFRIPNPDVEKNEGKILLETLNSIPRNYDIGKAFYEEDIPPIFEVMIPMCFSEKNLIRVNEYYKNFIVKNQEKSIYAGDITVKEWIGKFKPDEIRVTPLFETKETITNAASYVKKYIEYEKIKDYQRVWFARSDPALNYGSVTAVLMARIGLQGLHELQEKSSIDILPIFGCGSAPFRGNFKPTNAKKMVTGYPSVQTFTIQSAFKYDYPVEEVIKGVNQVKDIKRKAPLPVDVEETMKIIEIMEKDYIECIKLLAETINLVSHYIPSRRKRKLHIDLFGYARKSGNIKLPRAIKFCASLYSLGLPPEILGLSNLKPQHLDKISLFYDIIDQDLKDALQYYNKDNLSYFPKEIQNRVKKSLKLIEFETDEEHKKITSEVLTCLKRKDEPGVQESIVNAARIRQFLG